MEKPELSLIVALYNEAGRFGKNYPIIVDFLQDWGIRWELILVDDGSDDETWDFIREAARKDSARVRAVKLESNHGQGAAIKMGMLLGQGDVLAYTDSDLSTPLPHLQEFRALIAEGADVVIGSRWTDRRIRLGQPWLRRAYGRVYYRLIHWLFSIDVVDTNCGFKAYRREVAHALFGFVRSWRWVFNLEHLLIAGHYGFKIKEVTVRWHHDGTSRVKLHRDIFFTLWELLILKLRLMLGIYPKVRLSSPVHQTATEKRQEESCRPVSSS